MKRSWIDALVDWGTTCRVPWWILALTFWILEVLAIGAVQWIDGSREVGHFFERTVDTFYGVFAIVSYGALRATARRAFDRFRPALDVPAEEADRLRHRLATLTPRVALIGTIAGAAFGTLALISDPAILDLITTSVAATIVIGFVVYTLNVLLVGIAIAQLIKQLWMVVGLHRRATRVDLFRPEPAHAFSRLTALGGVITLTNLVYSMLTDPTTLTNPVWIGFGVGSIVLAIVAFLAPLRGMHSRLRGEKLALLDGSAVRIEAVSAELHRLVDAGSYAAVAEVRGVLDALDDGRTRIRVASTWPWEGATLRGFATTLVVPVAIWFVTAVLGKTLGF
jgi:hypothetical protein